MSKLQRDMASLYLVWHEPLPGPAQDCPIVWQGDAHPLTDEMWLVRSELTRSRLYHLVKKQLPGGSALMVAPLNDRPSGWPKFKGMAAGALAWLRRDEQRPPCVRSFPCGE